MVKLNDLIQDIDDLRNLGIEDYQIEEHQKVFGDKIFKLLDEKNLQIFEDILKKVNEVRDNIA